MLSFMQLDAPTRAQDPARTAPWSTRHGQRTPLLSRRSVAPVGRSSASHQPLGRLRRRLDVAGERGPGRRGDSRRRRRGRHDAKPAGVRAGGDSREGLVGAEPPADGNRPRPRRRSGQADQRRAHRSRSRRHDVSGRERRSAPDRRRRDPARPRPARQGPRRHRAPLPHWTRRRHLAVQFPAQPLGAQARPRHRRRQSHCPQARDEDAALGPVPRQRARRSGPAEGRAQRVADVAAARRPPRHRRTLQAADVHRLVGGGLGDEGARRQEEGDPRTRRQRGRHRRRLGRRRVGREARGDRRLRVRGPELHFRPARVRARAHLRRLRHATSSRAWSRSSSAIRSTARRTSGR